MTRSLDLQPRPPQAAQRPPARDAVRHHAHPRRARGPPVAPRALVHDQVRQRGELLGGVRRLRRAPPRRRRPPSTGSGPTARPSSSSTSAPSPTSTSASSDAYAIDWDITLTPQVDVVLDRTEFTTWGGYGGLALRGRGDWTDTRLLLSDGTEHERLLGVDGDWLDLSGSIEGGEAGVLLLHHPHNHRHPVPWYASTKAATYGDEGWSNFANAAFLWHAPLEWPAHDAPAVPVPHRRARRHVGRRPLRGRVGALHGWLTVRRSPAPSRPPTSGCTTPRRPTDWPAARPHLHTACTEAYWVVAGTGAVQTLTDGRLRGGAARARRLRVVHARHDPPPRQRRRPRDPRPHAERRPARGRRHGHHVPSRRPGLRGGLRRGRDAPRGRAHHLRHRRRRPRPPRPRRADVHRAPRRDPRPAIPRRSGPSTRPRPDSSNRTRPTGPSAGARARCARSSAPATSSEPSPRPTPTTSPTPASTASRPRRGAPHGLLRHPRHLPALTPAATTPWRQRRGPPYPRRHGAGAAGWGAGHLAGGVPAARRRPGVRGCGAGRRGRRRRRGHATAGCGGEAAAASPPDGSGRASARRDRGGGSRSATPPRVSRARSRTGPCCATTRTGCSRGWPSPRSPIGAEAAYIATKARYEREAERLADRDRRDRAPPGCSPTSRSTSCSGPTSTSSARRRRCSR